MTYLLNLSVFFLYSLFVYTLKFDVNLKRKIFFILSSFHIVLFQALRNPYIYNDSDNYSQMFIEIKEWPLSYAFSLTNVYTILGQGYVIYNYILSRFTENPEILFFLSSVFSVYVVLWYYYKASYIPWISTIIYLLYPMLYLMSFMIVRQSIATAFVVLALYNIKNIKKSLFFSFIAFSFHYSAIIIFPFYIWNSIDLARANFWKIISIGSIVVVVLRALLGVVFLMMPRFDYSGEASNMLPLILMIILLFLHHLCNSFKRVKDDKDKLMLSYMVYATFVLLFSVGIPAAGRLSIYFLVFMPIMVTMLFKYCPIRQKGLIYAYVLSLLFLCIYLLLNFQELIPKYEMFINNPI